MAGAALQVGGAALQAGRTALQAGRTVLNTCAEIWNYWTQLFPAYAGNKRGLEDYNKGRKLALAGA